jgi:hypothetical protein
MSLKQTEIRKLYHYCQQKSVNVSIVFRGKSSIFVSKKVYSAFCPFQFLESRNKIVAAIFMGALLFCFLFFVSHYEYHSAYIFSLVAFPVIDVFLCHLYPGQFYIPSITPVNTYCMSTQKCCNLPFEHFMLLDSRRNSCIES